MQDHQHITTEEEYIQQEGQQIDTYEGGNSAGNFYQNEQVSDPIANSELVQTKVITENPQVKTSKKIIKKVHIEDDQPDNQIIENQKISETVMKGGPTYQYDQSKAYFNCQDGEECHCQEEVQQQQVCSCGDEMCHCQEGGNFENMEYCDCNEVVENNDYCSCPEEQKIEDIEQVEEVQQPDYCTCNDQVEPDYCSCPEYCECQVEEKEEMMEVKKQIDPMKLLIPLPDNEIQESEKVNLPKTKKPKKIILKKPPPKKVCPENVDNLEVPHAYEKPGPKRYRKLKKGHTEELIPKYSQVPGEPVECPPSNRWNLVNEPVKTANMKVKEPHRFPWNQTNEPELSTKLKIIAPRSADWNETNKPMTEVDEGIFPKEKPEFMEEKSEMSLPPYNRFRGPMEKDCKELNYPANPIEKILIPAGAEKFNQKPAYTRLNWNEVNRPMKNQPLDLEKPEKEWITEPERIDKVALKGKPNIIDWNKVNDEEKEIDINLTRNTKKDVFSMQNGQPVGIDRTFKNWNGVNEPTDPEELPYLMKKEFKQLKMRHEDDFPLAAEPEEILVNDDYNTVADDPNVRRNVKATIMKVKEGEEISEEPESIDVLENVMRYKESAGEIPDDMINGMKTLNDMITKPSAYNEFVDNSAKRVMESPMDDQGRFGYDKLNIYPNYNEGNDGQALRSTKKAKKIEQLQRAKVPTTESYITYKEPKMFQSKKGPSYNQGTNQTGRISTNQMSSYPSNQQYAQMGNQQYQQNILEQLQENQRQIQEQLKQIQSTQLAQQNNLANQNNIAQNQLLHGKNEQIQGTQDLAGKGKKKKGGKAYQNLMKGMINNSQKPHDNKGIPSNMNFIDDEFGN